MCTLCPRGPEVLPLQPRPTLAPPSVAPPRFPLAPPSRCPRSCPAERFSLSQPAVTTDLLVQPTGSQSEHVAFMVTWSIFRCHFSLDLVVSFFCPFQPFLYFAVSLSEILPQLSAGDILGPLCHYRLSALQFPPLKQISRSFFAALIIFSVV